MNDPIKKYLESEPRNKAKNQIPANKKVLIRILYGEREIGMLVRKVGDRWDKKKQLWQLPYREAINLGLEGRIEQL